MPYDLTPERMQQCTRRHCTSEKWASNGGCWPFIKNGNCKHSCTWHEMYGAVQTKEQRKNMICPECGGMTEWVTVMV